MSNSNRRPLYCVNILVCLVYNNPTHIHIISFEFIYNLVQSFDKGDLVKTDLYFEHIELSDDPLLILLITNK